MASEQDVVVQMRALQILHGDGAEKITVQRRYAERIGITILKQSEGLL